MNSSSSSSSSSSAAASSSRTEHGPPQAATGVNFSFQTGPKMRPTRPRLVKTRRHLNSGRTRNFSSSEFNPFRKTSESSAAPVDNGIVNSFSYESSSRSLNLNEGGKTSGVLNEDFVFGANENDCDLNLKCGGNERKLGCDNEGKVGVENGSESSRKFENVNFVFDNKRSETVESVSPVFGNCTSNVGVKWKLDKGGNKECSSKFVSSDGEKVNLGTEAESLKDSDIGFRFVPVRTSLGLNLDLKLDNRSSEPVEKHDSSGIGISFRDNQNELLSTSSSAENESKKGMGSFNFGFVFGSSNIDFMSNSNLGKKDSGKVFFGKSEFDSKGKVIVEDVSKFQKATRVNFSSNRNQGLYEGDIKSGNGYNVAEAAEKFEVGNESNSDYLANATSLNPELKLRDEMKKLNINNLENVCGTGMAEDSYKVGGKPTSALGEKSSTSDDSLETTCDQASDHPISKVYANISNMGPVKSGNRCGIDSVPSVNSSSTIYERIHPGLVNDSDSNHFSQNQVKDDMNQTEATATSSFTSFYGNSHSNGSILTEQFAFGVEKNESGSTSAPDRSKVFFTEFETPQWDPSSFKENLFPEANRNAELVGRKRLQKEKKSKKMKGKLKQCSVQKQHLPNESNTQDKPSSPGCYSPMDFSPYQEIKEADQFPEDSSFGANKPSQLYNTCAPSRLHSGNALDTRYEELAAIGKRYGDNEGDQICKNPNEESSGCYRAGSFCDGYTRVVSEAEKSSLSSHTDVTQVSEVETCINKSPKDKSAVHSCFGSGLGDVKSFTFSAPSSADGNISLKKRQIQKKSRSKASHCSLRTSSSLNNKSNTSSILSSGVSPLPDPAESQTGGRPTFQSKARNNPEPVKQASASTSVFTEACETWRLRGNQAYKNNDLPKAEDYYTQGINTIPSSASLECNARPLVLCYSNRAATRISLGRLREAIGDCMMAAALDPDFLKAYMRAANCHLVLGEVENALEYFSKCLESSSAVCLDRRTTIEAADGLHKAQRVAECINQATNLLEQKTSDAAVSALEILVEALSISSCSEKLLQMKAEALCMLRRYEEVIKICEKSLPVAEKNIASEGTVNPLSKVNGHECEQHTLEKLWRWHMISKSYFYMGKFEIALDLLQKLEQVEPIGDKHETAILESSLSLAATIRELLRCKTAGNEAVRSGRYKEAIEQYNVILSRNIDSRPFTAICFCNRAAANQALGQIADAIADCSLSMALDANYTKAVSRRAKLHEMLRDYKQAASDLQRLVHILRNQSHEKAKPANTSGGSLSKDLRQANRQLSAMEEEAKKGIPLDLYLVLGIKASDTGADVKKAYRKAALRHHPDKAGQFLVRNDSEDEGRLWKEIFQEVHKDAERLFKMIGEAYAILSDTTKRSQYDQEEEKRKEAKESDRYTEFYQSERSTSRRNWQGRRNTNSQYWW